MLAFRNGLENNYDANGRDGRRDDQATSCRTSVKFGPVTPEITRLICVRYPREKSTKNLSPNISESTKPVFTKFAELRDACVGK